MGGDERVMWDCVVCGATIWRVGTNGKRVTCSDACRTTLSRARRAGMDPHEYVTRRAAAQVRAWEAIYGPFDGTGRWDKEVLRDRLTTQVHKGIRVWRCKQCQKPYRNGGGRGRFCSKACQRAYQDELKAIRALADQRGVKLTGKKRQMKLCAWCGAPVGEMGGRRLYCGSACRQAAYRARWGKCRECGERFAREQWGAEMKVYCSDACRRTYWAKVAKDRRQAQARKPKPCRECGAMFSDASTRPGRQVYCGRRCKDRASYRRQRASCDSE